MAGSHRVDTILMTRRRMMALTIPQIYKQKYSKSYIVNLPSGG
jgi:hypothetical protein